MEGSPREQIEPIDDLVDKEEHHITVLYSKKRLKRRKTCAFLYQNLRAKYYQQRRLGS